MPVLTDDEVGLGVLTDADVGLGKAEPLGPPELIGPPEPPVLPPPRVEAPSPMGGMPLVFIPPATPTPEQATARSMAAPSTLLPSAPERFGPDVGLITPLLREVMPQVQEQEPWQTAALKAAAGVAVSPVEFATSPLGALTLAGGPIVPRVTSAAFAADMIGNAVKSVGDLYDNWQRMTPARKAEALVNIGGNVIMGGFLGKKAITGWGKQPLGLANVTQRQRVQAATELAESNPQLFGDLARDEVRRQVAVEERAKPPVVTPLPVVPEKREEPAPVPLAPEPPIRDITAPTTEAAEAMRAGVAERLEAGKAAPGTAAADASARAQGAVEAGRERVERAPKLPLTQEDWYSASTQLRQFGFDAQTASDIVRAPDIDTAIKRASDFIEKWKYAADLEGTGLAEQHPHVQSILETTRQAYAVAAEVYVQVHPEFKDSAAHKKAIDTFVENAYELSKEEARKNIEDIRKQWQKPAPAPPEEKALTAPAVGEIVPPVIEPYTISSRETRFGTRWQVNTPIYNKAGEVSYLTGPGLDGFKSEAEAVAEAQRRFGKPAAPAAEAKPTWEPVGDAGSRALFGTTGWTMQVPEGQFRIHKLAGEYAGKFAVNFVAADGSKQHIGIFRNITEAKKGAEHAKVEKPEAGAIPAVEREPALAGTEGEAEAGTAQRPSADQARQAEVPLTPPAAEAAKPTAPSTKAGEAARSARVEFEHEGKRFEVVVKDTGVEGLVRIVGVHRTDVAKPEGAVGRTDLMNQIGATGIKKAVMSVLSSFPEAKEVEFYRASKEGQRRYVRMKIPEPPPTPGAAAGGPELPSVGAASAAPGGIPPRAAIEQLADAFAGKAPTAERLAAFVRNAFNFGARGAKAKDALSAAVQGMKTSGTALWDALTKFQTPDDLLKAKGDLSAELETRGWRVRQFVRNVQASVPDKSRRAAIAKWIDAGGDDAVLAAGEAATKPEYKQAYRDARNLTPDERIQAENIQVYFDTRLREAIDAGVLEHGLDDYIHRIYEKDPSLVKRALAYVQSGILSRNPALAKKRLFEFDWQAEQQGFRPVQDFLPRIAAYEASLSRAIAARKFVQRMTELTAPDGRPIVGIKGLGVPLKDRETGVREGTVIKPLGDFKKNRDESDALNYRGDYEDREFPALSKWKWVSTDAGGKPIFLQGDVAIHPDYVKRVDALLKPSSVRKYAPLRTAQAISATVKQTMLDMSFFHQVQIAVHGLEHRVNPFRLVQEIDFENPNVQGLLKGGVTLGGEYYPSNLGEGLVGRSLTQHIPGLGQILETYHGWLFQDFIPRMKLTMGLHALERNRQRYAADLASGRMNEDALYLLTAKQANAAFGELNYTMLERNKTVQDMARLMLLAPDFLEARGRFVAQALTKYGTEQRVALLLGAITMWTAARVMNKIADDQWHLEPENLFNLVWRNNAYGLRTVQGDVLHMLTKPIQFWTNRLNPVYGRTMMELLTQRDQFGRKRDMWEQLKDAISTVQPIATRSSRERHLWESILNSFGVTARRWNDVKNAHELASKWKKENNIREQPGEFIYDSDKDPLRPLKLALSEQDDAGAVKELKRVLDRKVMTPEQVDKYFNRYAAAPFTGSRANDVRFMASLSADDKKTVQAAQQHRRAMLELYRKTRRQLQAATQPRPAMAAGVPLPAPVPLPPMFAP